MAKIERKQIEEEVIKIFVGEYGCHPQGTDLATVTFSELDFDSLDKVEFIMSVEDYYDVDFDQKSPMANFQSIKEIVDELESILNEE